MFAAGAFCGLVLWARADATIEGTVQLPKPAAAPATHPRYRNIAPENVGPPESPVAVIYLEGLFPSTTTTNTPMTARMDQKCFQFAPGVLPVQKGTTVEFPNDDDAYHSVFSYSKAKRFDLGRYRKDERPPPKRVFDKAGVVKLYCEIHEHMRGTILVLDTPHFTKTDTNGNYRLEHLPTGKYTLKAWIDEATVWERQVDLEEGKTLQVAFPGK